MAAYSLEKRILSLTTPLGANVLLPEIFRGTEGLSELFSFELEVLAEPNATVAAKDLIGRRVTVGLQISESGDQRYFNGIVSRFEVRGGDEEFNTYHLHLVPNLWLLTLNTNTRVFQNKTVLDIVKEVLKPYNISPKDNTSATYPPLDYCTQYRETDFQFISRLMERWGMFYRFEHTADDHTLQLEDTSSLLPECVQQSEFRYAPESGDVESYYDYVIQEFSATATLVTGKQTVWDYRSLHYATDLKTSSETRGALGPNAHEAYDYLGSADAVFKLTGSDRHAVDSEQFLQEIRRDISDTPASVVDGVSNARVLEPGRAFKLAEHPARELNAKYLVVSVAHTVRQMPTYRTQPGSGGEAYRNEFSALPFSVAYRAPQLTPKPVVGGAHTAKVVVLSGADSHMDKYGRVCVQFFWDRLRTLNSVDNTLLRVAQPWAGSGWGTFFWPRVGDEVIVDFIEGDPDQPIVVGSVYNGLNLPKYNPQDQYTRSGLVTRSSLNGDESTANELRFEDAKGKEQIFINAQKDMDLRVENDARTFVGNAQHIVIKQKQLQSIGADKGESITGNHLEKVGQGADRSVGQNFNEKIGMNYSLNVGMNQYNKVGMVYVVDSGEEVHVKGGVNVVIEGGVGVCLSGPGGFISIDPSGVTIQGLLVKINSGGAQLQGSPAQTQDPKAPDSPDVADDGSKGTKLN